MHYHEQKMNLFQTPANFALVHCISADFAMGAGIAKQFTALGVKNFLKNSYPDFQWHGGICLPAPLAGHPAVFNLVTKEKYWNKPTLQTMQDALQDLKQQTILLQTEYLAMPLIGCGLDRLQWNDVSALLQTIFQNTNVNILVCKL